MQKTNIQYTIFLFLVFIFLLHNCGNKKESIAEVYGQKILLEDFSTAYRSYLIKTGQKDNLKLRNEFLMHLVDKELVYHFAETSQFIDQVFVQDALKSQKEQDLLNIFFREDVKPTFNFSDEQIRSKYKQSKTEIHTRYLLAETKEEAFTLKQKLNNGESFEQLAKDCFKDPKLSQNGGDLSWSKYGDLEIAYEDVAYNLNINEISDPVKLTNGWGIIQLLNRKGDVFIDEQKFRIDKKKFTVELLSRYQEKFIQHFNDSLMTKYHVKIDADGADKIYTLYTETQDNNNEVQQSIINANVVKSDVFDFNVNEVIVRLNSLTPYQKSQINDEKSLNKAIEGLAVREILEHIIDDLKIVSDKRYRSELANNRFERVLKEFKTAYQDTISIPESVLREHYEENVKQFKTETRYELSELAVNDSVQASLIKNNISDLGSFEKAAEQYSILERSKGQKGYLGQLGTSQLGLLAEGITQGKEKEIVGPLKYGKKYYIFYVHKILPERQMSFDEAVQQLISEKLIQYRETKYIQFIHRLREKADIKINNDLLSQEDIIERRNV